MKDIIVHKGGESVHFVYLNSEQDFGSKLTFDHRSIEAGEVKGSAMLTVAIANLIEGGELKGIDSTFLHPMEAGRVRVVPSEKSGIVVWGRSQTISVLAGYLRKSGS